MDSCEAVSQDIARDMATGAPAASQAYIALSINGYAGLPGKDEEGEEGLVHFGCDRKNDGSFHREERFGAIGRNGVHIASLRTTLDMLEEGLKQ